MRLFRRGATAEGVSTRTALLNEIAAASQHLPFETPIVFAEGTAQDRIYTIEKRIAGTALLTALAESDRHTRNGLIEQYMETAWLLSTIDIQRPYFGELCRDDAVQTPTLQDYLSKRAKRSLRGSSFANIDTGELAAMVGEPIDEPAFVHLDYFAGNVMAAGGRISAVIDFGYSSIIGDRRMNPVIAAAYLTTAHITPIVTQADRNIAFDWLKKRDLLDYYERIEKWLAAYWLFASDDVELYNWCCSILGR